MNRHCTKAELYRAVCALRKRLNIPESDQPLNMISLCEALPNLALGFPPFKTPGLKGVSCLSTDGGPDIILLNGNLSWRENNFTCGHELIHVTLHRDGPAKSFNCFEKARPNQDRFLEWQMKGPQNFFSPHVFSSPLFGNGIQHYIHGKTIYALKGNWQRIFASRKLWSPSVLRVSNTRSRNISLESRTRKSVFFLPPSSASPGST